MSMIDRTNGSRVGYAGTSIPNQAVEHKSYGSGTVREYKLTPEELEEVRQKYPATKRDTGFKKPVAHNPREDMSSEEQRRRANLRYQKQEEEQDMTGQRMSKEGPSCGLTKKVFLEQIAAGETVPSIEKAWGMKYNTLAFWVKKWGCRGITPGNARELLAMMGDGVKTIEPDKTQLLREREVAPASDTVSHTMLREYKDKAAKLEKELAESKRMFDEAYQRNLAANTKIGEHLQAIQELREEVEHWRGQADNAGALAAKAAEESMAKIERLKERDRETAVARNAAENELVQAIEENDRLRDEINRLITERDELVSEIDELHQEKTGWDENERILNHLVEQLRADLRDLRISPIPSPTPTSEVQLLDRSIAELTRAKWILNRLTASGE